MSHNYSIYPSTIISLLLLLDLLGLPMHFSTLMQFLFYFWFGLYLMFDILFRIRFIQVCIRNISFIRRSKTNREWKTTYYFDFRRGLV